MCSNRLAVPRVLPALVLGITLGGCSSLYWDRSDTIAYWAGDAPAANIAVHTVDPWPPQAAKRRLTANGEVMQRAAERYRTNKVIPPRPMGTSSVQTSVSPAAAAPGGTPGSP
jgi:hypothetical protein